MGSTPRQVDCLFISIYLLIINLEISIQNISPRCFGFHPCTRGQGPHGQPRCMVLASDEWRVFDIGYTNQHYELLPFLCHNHALFHGAPVVFCILSRSTPVLLTEMCSLVDATSLIN
ncbi:hypothetical protein ZWY2020_035718 [Hordeum vulgare]|nr:hypothetical protein ZWY2020_035718 [Hordeum vulgare]